jgi:nitrous oxidase accessory protein NosD
VAHVQHGPTTWSPSSLGTKFREHVARGAGAPNPWVDGFAFTRGTDGFGTMPYHPTQASMDAVAAAWDVKLGPPTR